LTPEKVALLWRTAEAGGQAVSQERTADASGLLFPEERPDPSSIASSM